MAGPQYSELLATANQHLDSGDYASAYSSFSKLVEVLEPHNDEVVFEALLGQAHCALFLGDSQKLASSLEVAEQRLHACFSGGDASLESHYTAELAQIMDEAGFSERAVRLYRDNIERIQEREGSHSVELVKNMVNLSVSYQNMGEHSIGWHVLDRAELASRGFRDDPIRGLCCYNMGLREGRILCNYQRAQHLLREAANIFEVEDSFGVYHLCLLLLSKVEYDYNHFETAQRLGAHAAWASLMMRDLETQAEALALQSACAISCDDFDKASLLLQRASSVAPENLFVVLERVRFLFVNGRQFESIQLCERGLSLAHTHNLTWSSMMCHYWLAKIYHSFDVSRMAAVHIEKAHDIAQRFIEPLDDHYKQKLIRQNPEYILVIELHQKVSTS